MNKVTKNIIRFFQVVGLGFVIYFLFSFLLLMMTMSDTTNSFSLQSSMTAVIISLFVSFPIAYGILKFTTWQAHDQQILNDTTNKNDTNIKSNKTNYIGVIAIILVLIVFAIMALKSLKPTDTQLKSDNSKIEIPERFDYDSLKKIINNTKTLRQFENSNIKITFNQFSFQNEFIFDRDGYQWRYRKAERDEKFLISVASITAKPNNKNPMLPVIYAYKIDSTGFLSIAKFEYQFYKWNDYGTYLGNDYDFGNDFAYTETIRFDIGLTLNKNDVNSTILIVASNQGKISRINNQFSTPNISYIYHNDGGGYPNMTLNKLINDYTIIDVINKDKLK